MAKARLFLDLRCPNSEGRGSLRIMITSGHTQSCISFGMTLSPDEWDGTQVVKRPDRKQLTAIAQKHLSDVQSEILRLGLDSDGARMTARQIRDVIERKYFGVVDKEEDHGPSFLDVYDKFMSRQMAQGTRSIYRSMLSKITNYSGNIESLTFDKIDRQWLEGFDSFMSNTQSRNGRNIYLRSLRAICNYALDTGAATGYPFRGFDMRTTPTRKRDISPELLRKFLTWPIRPSQERYRDYFTLMFCLIGINAVDLFTAKQNQLVDGRLEYERAKTGKIYSIKVEPEAQALLDKYKGRDWLVDVMDCYADYKQFLHKMNRKLKLIGEENTAPRKGRKVGDACGKIMVEPLIPQISTYYARHTWATIAYNIGIPIDVIRMALGHSGTSDRVTMIYINPDPKRVDEANRMVLDFVFHG